eukprot:CAMPEP_0196144098 /NCGR_PEP_ID=MMETSP0910-20130528/15064_1 /TAXON_ID=49265 /ORGANISM="Thalassiosira rotula, Strain GSO102" /LENGTH=48 /DNA_ID= /DNA_START= /DNA_END= /DNA_ORIENTATION=
MSNILCVASQFDIADITDVAKTLLQGDDSLFATVADVVAAIKTNEDIP